MGCHQSHFTESDEGENFDDLNETCKLPVMDYKIPLTVRQSFKLRQSWKGVKRKIEETGIEMFIR